MPEAQPVPNLTTGADPYARIAELEQERRHLLAIIDILEEISGTLHFVDILQAITQKLGELYGLDRCSIFLAERRGTTARLVASYENPAIRNYMVDLDRYPELKRALQSGEVVFIPDGQTDPELKHIRNVLERRGAKTITVVPIAWRGVVIGALFFRTFREGSPFSDSDIRFFRVIGSLTAKVLRNAYRYERLVMRQAETSEQARRANLERVALVGFLNRLLLAFGRQDEEWDEGLLSESAGEELDRLAEVAITVLREEGKGR
jgi:two-component system cell cycle response regulator